MDRYRNETLRLYGVMDRRLADVEYLAGAYSIADMATWPWVRVRWLHKIDLAEFPNVARWYDAIGQRPAVQRGVALLDQREKIGNPDEKAREALFGQSQLTQGKARRVVRSR
jgi:GST-like protein